MKTIDMLRHDKFLTYLNFFGALYTVLVITMFGLVGYMLYESYQKQQSMSFACKTFKGYYIYSDGKHYCFTSDNLFHDHIGD